MSKEQIQMFQKILSRYPEYMRMMLQPIESRWSIYQLNFPNLQKLECSWFCATYYYSLTQTSILSNTNCASGNRALKVSPESKKFPIPNCASGNRALEISQNLRKFPFLKCASGNRAVNFFGNFRETFGNFFETVLVVIGQESVLVGMCKEIKIYYLNFLRYVEPSKLCKRLRNTKTFI